MIKSLLSRARNAIVRELVAIRNKNKRDTYQVLCKAIGHMSITWALAEQSLDFTISMLFKQAGASKLPDCNVLPTAIKRKIKFVRICLEKIPALSVFKQEASELMDKFSRLKEYRHNMIHAVLADINDIDGKFRFHSVKAEQGQYVHRGFEIDLKNFPAVELEFSDLASASVRLAAKIEEHFPE